MSLTLDAYVAARPYVGKEFPDLSRGTAFQKLALRAHLVLSKSIDQAGPVLGDVWARAYGTPPHATYYGSTWDAPKFEGMRIIMRAQRLDPDSPAFQDRLRATFEHGVPALLAFPDTMRLLVSPGEQLDIHQDKVSEFQLHRGAVDLVSIVTSFDFLA